MVAVSHAQAGHGKVQFSRLVSYTNDGNGSEAEAVQTSQGQGRNGYRGQLESRATMLEEK